jgi:hypothetical protein
MSAELEIIEPELTARVNALADDLSRKLPLGRVLVLWRLYKGDPARLRLVDEIPVDVSNEALRLFLIDIRDELARVEAIIAAKRAA